MFKGAQCQFLIELSNLCFQLSMPVFFISHFRFSYILCNFSFSMSVLIAKCQYCIVELKDFISKVGFSGEGGRQTNRHTHGYGDSVEIKLLILFKDLTNPSVTISEVQRF